MSSEKDLRVKGATYQQVDQSYLEQRQLKKSAGWVLLWALGVGAVISGDFFGWNFGLAAGGFGGLLIATFFIAIMYVAMVLSIAEMSTALPTAGGFYGFTRNAFGPGMAYLNSITDMVEYVITPAVIVVGVSGYANALIDLSGVFGEAGANIVWWVVFYGIFLAINIWGSELSLKVSLVVTVASLAVLITFYISVLATGAFDPALLNNIPVDTAGPVRRRSCPTASTGSLPPSRSPSGSTWRSSSSRWPPKSPTTWPATCPRRSSTASARCWWPRC
jgi:ethanolamine permease